MACAAISEVGQLARSVLGRCCRSSRVLRIALALSAVLVLCGAMAAAGGVRAGWMPAVLEDFAPGADAGAPGESDWRSVAADLASRGLVGTPAIVVGTLSCSDRSRVAHAIGGGVKVTCLSTDPRDPGLPAAMQDAVGHDVLLLAPRTDFDQIDAQIGTLFDYLEPLPSLETRRAGQRAIAIPLFLGHRLHSHPVKRLRT